jgi:hypothetical protein
MTFSLDNPTVVAALTGAVTGAVLSAILMNLVRSWIERRAKTKEARERLVGEAMTIVFEHSARLLEFALVRKSGKGADDLLRADAQVSRSAGQLMKLQVEVWRLFPEWYAASAMIKLVGRVNAAYSYIRDSQALSETEVNTAMAWIHEQENDLMSQLADAASVKLHFRGGVGFLGFTNETKKQRLDVLRRDEHDPAPWEPYAKFQFCDSKLSQTEIEEGEEVHRHKIGKLRCKEHGRAAHVRLVGMSDNFNLQIAACCDKFASLVKSTLEGKQYNSRSSG